MRYYPRGILSPLRLPIPPQAQREFGDFTPIKLTKGEFLNQLSEIHSRRVFKNPNLPQVWERKQVCRWLESILDPP